MISPHTNPHSQIGASEQFSFFTLAESIWKHRVKVAGITLIMFAGSAGYAFLSAKQFQSSAMFFAPQDENNRSPNSLSSLGLSFGLSVGGDAGTPAEMVQVLIRSNRMARDIVTKFSMVAKAKKKNPQVSDQQLQQILITEVQNQIALSKDKANFITLSYTAGDAHTAQNIVFYILEHLEHINDTLQISSNKPMVKVIDTPELPLSPIKPRKKAIMIAGLFLGFFCGSVIAIAIEIYRTEKLKSN